jgi:hypothetical protein
MVPWLSFKLGHIRSSQDAEVIDALLYIVNDPALAEIAGHRPARGGLEQQSDPSKAVLNVSPDPTRVGCTCGVHRRVGCTCDVHRRHEG